MAHTVPQIELGILRGKRITGDFEGGDIATDGGVILVAEADKKLGLIEKRAACVRDHRDPTRIDHGLGAVAIIKRIVERLRAAWPDVEIVLRADGGFAKPAIYDWCEAAKVRTSCHRFLANQFRLLLHAAAFVLLSFIRRCLAGTELATAQICTLQRKLLRLGVRVRETARRVWFQFASSCPVRWLWPVVLERLRA